MLLIPVYECLKTQPTQQINITWNFIYYKESLFVLYSYLHYFGLYNLIFIFKIKFNYIYNIFFTAGLKIQKGINEIEEKCAASPGGGSLSSGCSIVTIASVSNSEPDPDYPNGPEKHPEKKHSSLNEKWYETTLQVSVPFFIAGIGTIGAGLVLAEVQVSVKKNFFKQNSYLRIFNLLLN